ncbi:MAG: hypothetical protein H0V37_05425, partial [Chloroflexia bacterium]|nr:hypothetical protein [Chloroflexia bacterium]
MTEPARTATLENHVEDPADRAWKRDQFQELMDVATGEIGRVVSSEKEPAGAHQFYFWSADDAL